MSNVAVSIVIPVYNGADYLERAISSAIGQTYSNTEVLIVDDGSNDNGATAAIIAKFGDRVRSIHTPNGGVASALNVGIREANGTHISWLSHDDEYLPGKIESQVRRLETQQNFKTVIYSGYYIIDHKSRVLASVDPTYELPESKLNDPLYPLLRGCIHGCSLLIPREAFFACGMFDESLVHTQDYTLWFDMFRRYGLTYDPFISTLSRLHKAQTSKIVPGRVSEGDQMWLSFLGRVTTAEMNRMCGSELVFFQQMVDFLDTTPFTEASRFAADKVMELMAHERSLYGVRVTPIHRSHKSRKQLSPSWRRLFPFHLYISLQRNISRVGLIATWRLCLHQLRTFVQKI